MGSEPIEKKWDLYRYTRKRFPTPEAAIAALKKDIDCIIDTSNSGVRRIRARFEQLGIPSWRTRIFEEQVLRGNELTPRDLEQRREVWQEAVWKSGEYYRGWFIIVYQEQGGWTWMSVTTRFQHCSLTNQNYAYPNRSKALLMARRSILDYAVAEALMDGLRGIKVLGPGEWINLNSWCRDHVDYWKR